MREITPTSPAGSRLPPGHGVTKRANFSRTLSVRAPSLAPGGKIDETKPRKSVRMAVLTVSDSRDASNDTSGDLLVSRLTDAGHELIGRAIVRDDVEGIRMHVRAWIDQ